jgi:hypothetical protein
VRQHLDSHQLQGESKHTPIGDRRKHGHLYYFSPIFGCDPIAASGAG